MSDSFDRAAAREAEILADQLAEQQRRAGLDGKKLADSAQLCRHCWEPIPLERRAAYPGVQLCVDCKAQQEKEEKVTHARY